MYSQLNLCIQNCSTSVTNLGILSNFFINNLTLSVASCIIFTVLVLQNKTFKITEFNMSGKCYHTHDASLTQTADTLAMTFHFVHRNSATRCKCQTTQKTRKTLYTMSYLSVPSKFSMAHVRFVAPAAQKNPTIYDDRLFCITARAFVEADSFSEGTRLVI